MIEEEEQSQHSLTQIPEDQELPGRDHYHDLDHEDLEHHEDHQQQQQQQKEPPDEDQQHPEESESEGMTISPTHDTFILELIPDNTPLIAPNISPNTPKTNKLTPYRKLVSLEKKLQIIKENLLPIPFVPTKTLDFSKHEKLFKRLGLWDFVHIELDHDIRTDLLAQLIANFNPQLGFSFVNEIRIMVNPVDLGLALKLPLKKDENDLSEVSDSYSEMLSEESILFVEDFVSNWIILYEDMPDEILNWTRFIKERQPHKVDWPGLIWFMVEKELMQGPQLVHCYYASHLQWLMKFQREDLFEDEPKLEVPIKEEEDVDDLKMSYPNDFLGQELENQQTELSLGRDKIEREQVRNEDVMDFQEIQAEEPGQWLLDGKNNVDEHCLRNCNLNEVRGLECHRESKEEQEEEEMYNILSRSTTLEKLSSANHIQAMGTTNISYCLPTHLIDHSSEELLPSITETHMSPGGPSINGNPCKREVSHEDEIRHHSLTNHHKRMRNNSSWQHKSSDFDMCIEQIDSWMGKARMMYEVKEQACKGANINQQVLLNELEQRQDMIDHLHKTKYVELQKTQVEIYQLERELFVMGNVLDDYKKGLKENRQAFSEYRERYQQPDEPLYKDVGETGGVVLSTIELEKQSTEREEQNRINCIMVEEKISDFQLGWFNKLETCLKDAHLLGNRLMDFEKEVKLLKDVFAKRRISDT